MSDLDLAAIKARERAATPGPWAGFNLADVFTDTNARGQGDIQIADCDPDTWDLLPFESVRANRDFIAAARTDVPALVAEVERLRFLLAECFRATGADPDGNDDAMLAGKAVDAVRRLREEADSDGARAEAAEARVAELEAAASRFQSVVGPCRNSPCGCGWDKSRDALRSLLAKGGAS